MLRNDNVYDLLSLNVLGFLLVGFLALQVVKTTIRAHFSPLRKIPRAGFLASYSRLLWLFPREFLGRITLDLPAVHRKFGPLVRIGPNEVSFYSMEIYDIVFKAGTKFRKDPTVYGEFVQGGHPALFSISDPTEHSKRRRLMGRLYTRTRIVLLEDLMLRQVGRWCDIMRKQRHVRDLSWACRALEADIVSEFSFGISIRALDALDQGLWLDMVAMNDEKARWMPVLVNFPRVIEVLSLIEDCVARFGWRTTMGDGLCNFSKWATSSWKTALSRRDDPSVPNLITTLVDAGLSPETALSEATENLGPGTDTTSATLAHILHALAYNPQFQTELYAELMSAGFPINLNSLEKIPKLQACVREGIRWTGAAAAMLPRVVPEPGVELLGSYIPEGTVLMTSPIWYLRDYGAFPDPYSYDPYRWLTAAGDAIREDSVRDRFYIPFSKGSNICMGNNFAYLELYLSVSQIIQHFQITSHYATTCVSGSGFEPIRLPSRKEWVAAVPSEKLEIILDPR